MPDDLSVVNETPDKLVDAAFVMAESGDIPSAIRIMEAACRLDDANKEVQEMLAQLYLEGDRPDDAVKAAQKAVDLDDQWPEAALTLARAHLACRALQEALRAFHICMELLAGSGSPLMSKDIEQEMAECEALQQRVWVQRIGGLPLKVYQAIGSRRGPGCVVWESGLALAEYLSQHCGRQWLHGRNCIELGAGTGIVGICAALLGAKVTLTDTASCLPLLKQNVEGHRNGIHCAGGHAELQILDWSETEDWTSNELQGYDVIFGADLVYNRTGVLQLLPAMQRLLKALPDVAVMLGHCSRHADVDDALMSGLKELGLALHRVAASQQDPRVSVYIHSPAGFLKQEVTDQKMCIQTM
ncbi:hypothetical protein CVIRNUC_002304 [Coccomyxa viridis]|uniref:Uncharacterized protein n=1 Tax=Coccomyxa viridis TaxID=1274662 RepID=A0AAV1HWH2_9CHLO|nr:hypothetical protein CVIRNUC_002304 [Coccomyxa viridis]